MVIYAIAAWMEAEIIKGGYNLVDVSLRSWYENQS
jgi:hypothetical protein